MTVCITFGECHGVSGITEKKEKKEYEGCINRKRRKILYIS